METEVVHTDCPRCGGYLVPELLEGDEGEIEAIKCFICARIYQPPNLVPAYPKEQENYRLSGRWSRKFAECIECQEKDSPHAAKGRCMRCHQKRLNHGIKEAQMT